MVWSASRAAGHTGWSASWAPWCTRGQKTGLPDTRCGQQAGLPDTLSGQQAGLPGTRGGHCGSLYLCSVCKQVYCAFRDDLLQAIKRLKVLGSGFTVIPAKGTYIIQGVPGELTLDHTTALQTAQVS